MSQGLSNLDDLAHELERRGDDAQRLDLVQRARRFERAWIEMAEALVVVERTRAYQRWGYPDVYAYAEKELRIRRPTVEKLTLSYMTVRRHAPRVLERDGVEQTIPSIDAVDYFARALGARDRSGGDAQGEGSPPPAEVVKELRAAVFDDLKPIAAIRREFNAALFPKEETDGGPALIEKTRAAARRLSNLLRNLDAVPRAERERLLEALEALDERLGGAPATPPAREGIHA